MVQSVRLFMQTHLQNLETWPFVGHEELGRHLIQAMLVKRLPSVIMFVGPQAVGKTSAAIWLMKKSLCSAMKRQPCGICAACRQNTAGIHPDSVVIDSNSQNSVGISEIRDILQKYTLVPWQTTMRWLVIPNVERLTEAAANTMLKFLEEIPLHVQVIMTSSTPEKVLPTLRSRSAIYQWHLVSPATLRQDKDISPETIQRSAGRPGWLDMYAKAEERKLDTDQALATATVFLQHQESNTLQELSLSGDQKTILVHDELVVRDLLLQSVGSHRRLLWPQKFSPTLQDVPRAIELAIKYIDRHTFSPNIQPRLLYEDLHLV